MWIANDRVTNSNRESGLTSCIMDIEADMVILFVFHKNEIFYITEVGPDI